MVKEANAVWHNSGRKDCLVFIGYQYEAEKARQSGKNPDFGLENTFNILYKFLKHKMLKMDKFLLDFFRPDCYYTVIIP